MSLQSTSQHFVDLEYKSGAMMWFSSSLDTNSPWGNSFPFSAPVSQQLANKNKPVGDHLEPKAPVKFQVQQVFSTKEFVQVSSNQHWNALNPRFGPIQPEMNKKASKVIPTAVIPAELPLISRLPLTEAEPEDEATAQNLYKTEYCRSFEETGSCRYGMKCQFAHGSAELRPVSRHPKYKTEVCKTFHSIGTCPYGKRCRFIHIEASAQNTGVSPKISPQKCELKPAPAKQSFENVNGAGWSNNWNGINPTSITNVHSTPVNVKGIPPKIPAEQFSNLNVSKEPFERRSRLGIFQQICS
jgi:hypothetical protein